jgi:hypothetical protein
MIKSRKGGLAGSLVALLVFAFFSYPFSLLPYLIVFTFLLAYASDSGNNSVYPFSCFCGVHFGFGSEKRELSSGRLVGVVADICFYVVSV